MNTRPIRAAVAAACLLALAATPALAGHSHVMAIGGGRCVLLAANCGEEGVQLPLSVFEHNPNVDISPAADRLHPLSAAVPQPPSRA